MARQPLVKNCLSSSTDETLSRKRIHYVEQSTDNSTKTGKQSFKILLYRGLPDDTRHTRLRNGYSFLTWTSQWTVRTEMDVASTDLSTDHSVCASRTHWQRILHFFFRGVFSSTCAVAGIYLMAIWQSSCLLLWTCHPPTNPFLIWPCPFPLVAELNFITSLLKLWHSGSPLLPWVFICSSVLILILSMQALLTLLSTLLWKLSNSTAAS